MTESPNTKDAMPVADILKAKAEDCFRLAAKERLPRVKENYLSLGYHFEKAAQDIARRSTGRTPEPFFAAVK